MIVDESKSVSLQRWLVPDLLQKLFLSVSRSANVGISFCFGVWNS
jgi:hypothetical protein